MRGLVIEDPYMAHLKEAWSMRHHSNMLWIWYEDMKKDLSKTINSVTEFLGNKLTEQDVSRLGNFLTVKNLSFQNSKWCKIFQPNIWTLNK